MNKFLFFLSFIILMLLFLTSSIAALTSYEYDDLHRLIKVNHASGMATTYEYDDFGNRTSKVVSALFSKGDIDSDGQVGLSDVIATLQIASGISPGRNIALVADVDGDRKIGLENAFFVLCEVSDTCESNQSQTYVVQPGPAEGKDTYYGTVYLRDGSPDEDEMRFGGWGDSYYDYLQFDISTLPPANQVTSAQIHLYSQINISYDPQIDVSYITENWTEEGVSINSNPASVFYKRMDPVSLTPGWNIIDITDLYQDWKEGRFPNYGVKLSPNYTTRSNGNFCTSDYLDDPSLRPKLVIETND